MHKSITSQWRRRNRIPSGFSLPELILVILIIGIIGSLVMGSLEGLIENTSRIKNKRNAQAIAQVAAAAQAAGNATIAMAADLNEAVNIVMLNQATGSAGFTDMDFSVSKISQEEIEKAKAHLTFIDGKIQYNP